MDILTALNEKTEYSTPTLQVILGAWVLSGLFDRRANGKISVKDGDVPEEAYDKQSVYALLYSLYRSMGTVRSEHGTPYEFTFNTWGYAWPKNWGASPAWDRDPQRMGMNAYAGLFEFAEVKEYVKQRNGKVHVVEMGCGTGAGAHHVCKNVLPECTYEAVDMQQAAIETCKRKFVPTLGGRLVATRANCTQMPIKDGSADLVAVCETHVTEMPGIVTPEDERFFQSVLKTLKPGGFLVWGNAIPDSTWKPCFAYLESIGMKLIEARDVTKEAVLARDQDEPRIEAYCEQALNRFYGFRIPFLGQQKRIEAEQALKNFARHPRTRLYENMRDGTDTYKVVLFQKAGTTPAKPRTEN